MRQDQTARTAGVSGTRRAAGELEAAALAVLQAAGSALTPGQVRDRLGEQPGGHLAYSTVVTILSRLYAKGVLTRFRSGMQMNSNVPSSNRGPWMPPQPASIPTRKRTTRFFTADCISVFC